MTTTQDHPSRVSVYLEWSKLARLLPGADGGFTDQPGLQIGSLHVHLQAGHTFSTGKGFVHFADLDLDARCKRDTQREREPYFGV